MLMNTQRKNINEIILKDAIISTVKHRENLEKIEDCERIIEAIADKEHFLKKYKKDNFYTQEVEYNDLINSIMKIGQMYKMIV